MHPPAIRQRKPLGDITNEVRNIINQANQIFHPTTKQLNQFAATLIQPPPDRTTIYRITHTKPTISNNHGGKRRHDSVTDEEKKIVCEAQDRENDATYAEIALELQARTGKKRCISSIFNIEKQASPPFTTKQLCIQSVNKNTPEAIEARKIWVENASQIIKINRFNSIWIDETPWSMAMHRKRARSRKGQKAICTRKRIRSDNISLCAAISPAIGLIHYEVTIGKQKNPGDQTKKLTEFMKHVVDKIEDYPRIRRYDQWLIADNCSSHNYEAINEWLESNYPTHIYHPLPPHSPSLNPIEQVWSIWKTEAKRKYYSNNQEVLDEIARASTKITEAVCAHIFIDIVCKIWPACLAGKPQ